MRAATTTGVLRWLGGVLLAIGFAVACVFLGNWQWSKYVTKRDMAAVIATNYTASPVPLPSAVFDTRPRPDQDWLPVSVSGTYDTARTFLVRNRILDSNPGYEVLVPLTTASGTILVDRGWLPIGDHAADLPNVPPPAAGPVSVTGWLRIPEPQLGKHLPTGQLASIAPADATAQTGLALAPAYIVMRAETPAAPTRPTPPDVPSVDLGPNQAYAFQWWLFSVFGFVMLGWRARVARSFRDGSADPADPADRPSRRPKKVRIWDEEDA